MGSKKNKKVDLLIFDDPPVEFNFDKINYAIYKNEEINIFYLIKSFSVFIKSKNKNLHSLSNIYFKFMIESYDPIATVGKDRFGKILKFKKIFPEKKTIFYEWAYTFNEQILITQFLIRGYSKKFTLDYLKSNKSNKIKKMKGPNYYLANDKRSKNFIEKIYDTNVLLCGSVRNNERQTRQFKKTYDFMFISNYRPTPPVGNLRFNKIDKFINCTIFAIKNLSDFCEKNNKKLCIALASTREEKKYKKSYLEKKELDFYNKYAKNFSIENLDSYNLANKARVIICTHSNLGYELLARKKRFFL